MTPKDGFTAIGGDGEIGSCESDLCARGGDRCGGHLVSKGLHRASTSVRSCASMCDTVRSHAELERSEDLFGDSLALKLAVGRH